MSLRSDESHVARPTEKTSNQVKLRVSCLDVPGGNISYIRQAADVALVKKDVKYLSPIKIVLVF
jgi:hypothetical protein